MSIGPGVPPPGQADQNTAPTSDPRLVRAYEAAQDLLRLQDAKLGDLRTRAAGVLTIGALLSSFGAGLGFLNRDVTKGTVIPAWIAWLLVAALLVITYFVIRVQYKVDPWHYPADPAHMMTLIDWGLTDDDILRDVVPRLMAGLDENGDNLVNRQRHLRNAIYALGAEAVILAATFAYVR